MSKQRILAVQSNSRVGKEVVLKGWASNIRDHGGLIFIDLRDWSGIIQIVIDPSVAKDAHKVAQKIGTEFVIEVVGKVVNRDKGLVNDDLETGKIEIHVSELEIINKSKEIPFPLDTDGREIEENLRHKYRFLDIRRERVREMIKKRHEVILFIRNWMDKNDFVEVQTPILTVSSPEGARDFVVPSRLQKGKFYALPQAPQQFKQLLMVGGVHRYFQIAPCFRDEDPRHDRHYGAFYQLDVECSFMTQEEFFNLMEPIFVDIVQEFSDKSLLYEPFPRIPYKESMLNYGTDKPDIRFGMELADITELLRDSGMNIFKDIELAKALLVHKEFSRGEIDEIEKRVKQNGAKGLLWFKVEKDFELKSPVSKFFKDENKERLLSAWENYEEEVEVGDTIFAVAGNPKVTNRVMSDLRNHMGDIMELKDPDTFAYAWIVDYPMFEWDEETEKYTYSHNPFSMPEGGMNALEEKDPLEIKTQQYDVVCNGYEIASGAVRNHEPETFIKVFEIMGYSEEETRRDFGHMISAFEYGAPPHCGFAPGVDRIIMMLLDEPNIREIYAFPKSSSGVEVMTGAPRELDKEQLNELGIKIMEEVGHEVFERIIDLLEAENMEYELMEHKPVKTSEEAAKVRGTSMSMAPKAMLLKKEDGDFVMICIPADRKLDMKRVEKVLDSGVRLAEPSEVENRFGVKVGAVPPFGNIFGIEMYLDATFWKKKEVVFNAGRRDRSIRMNAEDLIKVAKPVSISKETDFKK